MEHLAATYFSRALGYASQFAAFYGNEAILYLALDRKY